MKALARGSLVLLIASTAACTATDARIAKAQKRDHETLAVLALTTDADSLAAAALLSGKDNDLSVLLLARATAAAPDRPDLLWLQAMRCTEVPACEPAPLEQRLRELDPTNGAGWWGELTRAAAAHDAHGIDVALSAISHAERVDTYWTTLIAHLSRAVANTKKMSVADSEVTVIGSLAAQGMPAYQAISANCKGERLQQPGVTNICRGVAKALQNGDTYVTAMIGVAIAKRVWPENSSEWKAAVEERRVHQYRSQFYPKVTLRFTIHPGEYLTLCAQNRREQDVLAAQLFAAGYNPNPPELR
jgi:hypothetical protein